MSSAEDPDLRNDIELIDEVARRSGAEVGSAAAHPPMGSLGVAQQGLDAARPFLMMGTQLPPEARLRSLKRLLLAVSRPVSSHQVQFNLGMFQAVEELLLERERSAARLQAALATSDVTISEQAAAIDELREEVAVLRGQIDRLARIARDAGSDDDGGGGGGARGNQLSRELDASHDRLYRDLEATFRGSAEQIRDLVSAYLDDVATACESAPLLDIGSGRGEWLDVLASRGIEAYGIEINEAFVADCSARGLDVRRGDALAHLHDLPDASLGAVTAFHVAEHLDLDTLIDLIDAALRVLRPGGVLLLETPNPTNVSVGAASFYLDPTHLKPLHPQFLEFLVANRGFSEVEVRYVHPSEHRPLPHWPDGASSDDAEAGEVDESLGHLNWALFGPLDYAIVARRAGGSDR
ncbi:MAG: class I SAM-dependent methyltransferase [Acidimicrobiales bacterium]|nr:class I SAM-dependent methyltransferase [Acidimicrobiales bacterium]